MVTTRSPDREDLRPLLALSLLPGVGSVGVAQRLADAPSAAAALAREPSARAEAALVEADAALQRAEAHGMRGLPYTASEYPGAVRDLPDPPPVLWAQGHLAAAAAPAVAIVGTREASAYGLRAAALLARACARAGVAVVSGLARGVDAAAHVAALEAGGRTVGVVGTGLDRCYPRGHRALQQRIATEGLLLSEHPPGTEVHGGSFPRRNRIIAALASVTVVVEAGERSGALITASQAVELQRVVAAVPGPIDAPASRGANRLLAGGAHVIADPADLLALLSVDPSPLAAPVLDGDAARVFAAIGAGGGDRAAIERLSGLTPRAVTVALATLELEGLIRIGPAGHVHGDA